MSEGSHLNLFPVGERGQRSAEFSLPCFRCGVCCTRYQVLLSQMEARRIADGLGLAGTEFRDRYADPRWSGTDFLLRQENGACVFLRYEESNRTSCLIQAFKPASCQEWGASLSREECREGLSQHWGLAVSPSGRLEGSQGAREHFQTFLESLAV